MKILFISQYFYPEVFKGNDIVFDFIEKGYDVTVLTGKPNYPQGKFYEGYGFFSKKEEIINGAKILRAPLFPRGNGNAFYLVLNYFSFVFFSYFTILFRLKGKYDLIFVQQLSPVTMVIPGLWIKKKQKIPLLLWVLDLWPESISANTKIKKGIIINSIEKLVKTIYNKSDIIFISSKFFKNSILEKCKDKSKRIEYLPNWAEDVFENPKKLENTPNIELPKGFNIMFAGNIGESQGFEPIVAAAEKTKEHNINWVIVGDGRKIAWLKKEIEKRSLSNIILLGRYPLELMPYFFKKADAMLVSLKDEPIFSLTVPAKVQAYMASKKIVLGILNGEGNELINQSKCGFAVSAGDYDSLANKAIKLAKMPINDRKMMENNAYSFYQDNFKKEKLFSKLDKIFKEYEKRIE